MITDEMVKRAASEYLSHKGEIPWRVLRRGAELWENHAPAIRAALEAVESIRAALQAAAALDTRAGVKPLKWGRAGWIEGFSQPDGIGIWYSIQPDRPVMGPGEPPFSCFVRWGSPGQNMREELGAAFKNIDEAKAAAQADYERRILSALSAPPAPVVPDGWKNTDGKFKLGDRVCKPKGSSWHGIVVGFYSTKLTPIGYAVESEREPGSVQIYPDAALAAAPLPPGDAE